MTQQRLRVGVVGTGALGFHHARLLRRMEGAEFAGIFDVDPVRATEVARELDTVAHPSLDALLDRVDAVSIAVPTPAHTEVGLAVLSRGIAALVEKPLADSLEGAERLVRQAAATGVVLQVGHVERFNRAVRAAAPYLDEPRFLQCERLAPFQPRGTDVAVILDLMIHDLDLILELVRSEVREVRATGIPVLTPHVDIANARVEFATEHIFAAAAKYGVPIENLWLDPLVLTVNGNQDQAEQTINAVRFFKQLADPPPKTTCGLSNVSNSCPAELRHLLNRVFLVMMAGAGLDSAILDPLDHETMEAIRILDKRDDSTPKGRLYLGIYDAYAAMEQYDTIQVDMSNPELSDIAKTVNILQNKTLYAHGYLKL